MTTVTETQVGLPTGTWQLDPVRSQVGFAVHYLAGTFRASVSPVEATLVVDEEGRTTLIGVAKVENIRVQDENLTAHLLAPDFFDAERTPELRFASTSIRRSGKDVAVAGELTIKGRTEPVELTGAAADPIVDPYGRERLVLRLETTVDRARFGLDWNTPLPSGEQALGNDVALTAELYFVKA